MWYEYVSYEMANLNQIYTVYNTLIIKFKLLKKLLLDTSLLIIY